MVKFNLEKQGSEEAVDHKIVYELKLRRLKRVRKIKPFSSVFFHFYVFEWNMVQLGAVHFFEKVR